MAVNPLIRYNEIQKALSAVKRQQGWKLQAGKFQGLASQVYQKTKGQPLKQVLNNIDFVIEDIRGTDIPVFPLELLEWNYYFDFDANAPGGNGQWNPEVLGPDVQLMVRSPQLFEDDIPVDASILSYQDHFKDFSDYCNKNRMYFPDKYGPMWRFTEPVYDWNEQKYLTLLEINDTYGYEPGMGGTENRAFIEGHEPEIEAEKPEPQAEVIKETNKEDFEIRKIQAETEKTKASTSKLTELNKAVANLRSDLREGLISKKQYSKMLDKLYDM
jgi:hypothetical protein